MKEDQFSHVCSTENTGSDRNMARGLSADHFQYRLQDVPEKVPVDFSLLPCIARHLPYQFNILQDLTKKGVIPQRLRPVFNQFGVN